MEHHEITKRAGCQALAVLFTPGLMDTAEAWDRGYMKGVCYALWTAGLIDEAEHDALLALAGVKQ